MFVNKNYSLLGIIRRVYSAPHPTTAKTSTSRGGNLKYEIFCNVFAATAYTGQERYIVLHTLVGVHKNKQKILMCAGPKKRSVGKSREMWEENISKALRV